MLGVAHQRMSVRLATFAAVDDHDEGGGGHEQPDRQARAFAHHLPEGNDGDPEVRGGIIRFLEVVPHARVDRLDFTLLPVSGWRPERAGRPPPSSGCESTLDHERTQWCWLATMFEQGVRASGKEGRRFEHADHGDGLLVHGQLLADDAGISAESPSSSLRA
jgi:hypothetical protein